MSNVERLNAALKALYAVRADLANTPENERKAVENRIQTVAAMGLLLLDKSRSND